MRFIRDIKLFENIPILVRTALNVPVENGKVANDYRLRRALPTIQYLQRRGARIVLISHIAGAGLNAGRQGTETLKPVASALGKLISNVSFFPETIGVRTRAAVRDLVPGHILVLENLRRNVGEKTNDKEFAKELSALGDIFVQDCFDTCHRQHASIVGVPGLLPSYAGYLLEEEVSGLSRALTPKSPSFAVIGGAKFSTKEAVLFKLLKTYDKVFVGGALANDFLKAAGREVGESLVSEVNKVHIKKILMNSKLVIPEDSVVVDEKIMDHGQKTIALLSDLTRGAKTILWNGPLGKYEDGFMTATAAFARAVADSGARSVVGGGDTIAALEQLGFLSRFSFVSTGGGAMLQFLSDGTLPGIRAID